MRRLFAIVMAVLLLAAMTACAPKQPAQTQPQTQPQPQTETTEGTTQAQDPSDEGGFAFVLEGVELIPGEKFDAAKLPEALSVFEVPSCAIEGTDNVYDYGVVEVTAFDDGTAPVIYSVFVKDVNTSTPEGLYQGDDLAKVEDLYGADYETNGAELVYTKGKTQLRIIMENDIVTSIEYRMVTQ